MSASSYKKSSAGRLLLLGAVWEDRVIAANCESRQPDAENVMLKWALIFALISIVAGVLGFTGIAAGAAGAAKLLFVVALIVFLIFLSLGLFVVKAVD